MADLTVSNMPGVSIDFQVIATTSPVSFYWACEGHPSVKFSMCSNELNSSILQYSFREKRI